MEVVMGVPETLAEILAKLDVIEAKVDADRVIYTKCASCNAEGITDIPVGCDACKGIGFRVHGKTSKVEE